MRNSIPHWLWPFSQRHPRPRRRSHWYRSSAIAVQVEWLEDRTLLSAATTPAFDSASYEFSVPKDAAIGTVVGRVAAAGSNGEGVTYALGLGQDNPGPVQFLIDQPTGLITVASPLNARASVRYSLAAYARRPVDNTAWAAVIIDVTDSAKEPGAKSGSGAGSGTGTISATSSLTNIAPYADDDWYDILHDTTLNESAPGVMWNDWDDDGDPITAVLDSGPAHAAAFTFNSDGSFDYEPEVNWWGTDTFTYHVSDGMADSSVATVTINVTNIAPYADDDWYDILHDTSLNESAPGVMWNDWDDDGDPITAALVAGPTNAQSFTFNSDGSFEYVPLPGWWGADTFTYSINDGLQSSSVATVTINVTNIAPYADDDWYDILHDTTLNEPAPGVMWNDWDDDGDPITAVLDSGPTNGSLTYFNADGSFEYVPNTGYVGPDSFTYHVSDGLQSSAIATVTINVTNSVPVASDDEYSTLRGTALSVTAPGVLDNTGTTTTIPSRRSWTWDRATAPWITSTPMGRSSTHPTPVSPAPTVSLTT